MHRKSIRAPAHFPGPPQSVKKNSQSFAAHGDAPRVVPPRGIAASAYAKKVPQALFLNAAASDKTRCAWQVWNLCAKCAQIMRAAGCSLFKREPSPRGSRLSACQKTFLTSASGSRRSARAALNVSRDQMVGWLAASMILTNFSGTRDAPPIRPPSMSGCASRS